MNQPTKPLIAIFNRNYYRDDPPPPEFDRIAELLSTGFKTISFLLTKASR